MTRSVKEWIGKSDNASIPDRVRVRVFEAHNGICHISGMKIQAGMKWDVDHVIALCNGGEHRESNLAPALKEFHKTKTKDDLATKKKISRVRKKHLGLHKPKTPMRGRNTFERPEPNTRQLYGDI